MLNGNNYMLNTANTNNNYTEQPVQQATYTEQPVQQATYTEQPISQTITSAQSVNKSVKIRNIMSLIGNDTVDFIYDTYLDSFPTYLEHCCTDDQINSLLSYLESGNKFNADIINTLSMYECNPYLYENSLIFGIDRYLHWYKGYYFQLSGTLNGISCITNPINRLDWAMKYKQADNKIKNLLFIASALIPAFYNDNFYKFIDTEEGKKLFNEFLYASSQYDSRVSNLDVNELLSLIETEEGTDLYKLDLESRHSNILGVKPLKLQLISERTGEPLAFIKLSLDCITIVWKNEVQGKYISKSFVLPKGLLTPATLKDNSEIIYSNFYSLFVEFMLQYCGFAGTNNIYPIYREDDIKGKLTTYFRSFSCYNSLNDVISEYFNDILNVIDKN